MTVVTQVKSPVKSFAISAAVWILTAVNTTAFIVSRNSFWISYPGQAWLATGTTENRTYLASEFERNLSCYNPLTCLRSGGAFLSQAFIAVITFSSEKMGNNLTIDQRTFIILIGGLAWRILCLGIFVCAIAKLFNSLKIALLLVNSLLFLLSGFPLWQLGRLLINLPLDLNPTIIARANEAFVHMSFGDLIFYDYGFFILISMTILLLSKIKNIRAVSSWKFAGIGFLVASFYEAFVPIVVLATVLFVQIYERRFFFKALVIMIGQVTWVLIRAFTLRFTEVSNPNSIYYFDTSLINSLRRLIAPATSWSSSSLPSLAVQLSLIGFLAVASGVICGAFFSIMNYQFEISSKQQKAIEATTYATTVVIILSFLRPIFIETGRQSLGLSISLVLLSFTYSFNNFRSKKIRNKESVST